MLYSRKLRDCPVGVDYGSITVMPSPEVLNALLDSLEVACDEHCWLIGITLKIEVYRALEPPLAERTKGADAQ